MSYRLRFAEVKKEYLDAVRGMSVEEFFEYVKINNPSAYNNCEGESPYLNVWEKFRQHEIFDMGDCPYAMDIINVSEPLFTNPDTQNYFGEDNLYFCTQKSFIAAINGMRKMVIKNYQYLLDNPAVVQLHLEEKKREWTDFTEVMEINIDDDEKKNKMNEMYRPYSMDVSNPEIVTSWRYEYSIFEMVRIYKSFDWENNYLIFYGW